MGRNRREGDGDWGKAWLLSRYARSSRSADLLTTHACIAGGAINPRGTAGRYCTCCNPTDAAKSTRHSCTYRAVGRVVAILFSQQSGSGATPQIVRRFLTLIDSATSYLTYTSMLKHKTLRVANGIPRVRCHLKATGGCTFVTTPFRQVVRYSKQYIIGKSPCVLPLLLPASSVTWRP